MTDLRGRIKRRRKDKLKTSKRHKKITQQIHNEEEADDRLSSLPDKLLIHILSFLTTKQVVKTCSLSKRLRFVWTHLSELHLLPKKSSKIAKIRSFVECVGNMLDIWCGDCLEKFSVDFVFDECFAHNVNLWVQFAVKNRVSDLALICRASKELYVLPQMLYSNSSLTSLIVGFCSVSPPLGGVAWGSLKSLRLDSVELNETVIGKILGGCPVLKYLWLAACWGLKRLSICSRNVSTLVIDSWNPSESMYKHFLEISAPYVRVLRIEGNHKGRFKFENISSCVKVHLQYTFEGHTIPDSTIYHMKQLIERFSSVKELTLGSWCIEVLSRLVEKGWKLPHSDRLCLTLNAWRHKRSLPGILALLKSSPYLETLVINGRSFIRHQICVGRHQAASYPHNDNMYLSKLKTVTISHFIEPVLDGEPMLTLVQLLLKNARSLEKMVIGAKVLNANSNSADLAKVALKLVGFPRSSPQAVVTIVGHNL